MLKSRRKFKRFDLPLIASFRPTYGATEYSVGLIKNFSCEGLAIEANNFTFIQYENLELNLRFPHSDAFVFLSGNVAWKKQSGDNCLAGVKLKINNEENRHHLLKNVSSLTNIPLNTLTAKDNSYEVTGRTRTDPESRPARRKRKSSQKTRKIGFSKQYCRGGSKCMVTFRLPKEAAPKAQEVAIAGDFNNWNPQNTRMKRISGGDFHITLELHSKRSYRFKYLIDGHHWENDWRADKYVPNDFGSDDSLVIV
jgi:hypothetical protein